jgi:hypothetical protein
VKVRLLDRHEVCAIANVTYQIIWRRMRPGASQMRAQSGPVVLQLTTVALAAGAVSHATPSGLAFRCFLGIDRRDPECFSMWLV